MAVSSIAKQGDTPLTGHVTLSAGSGITLTQTGQDIEVAVTAMQDILPPVSGYSGLWDLSHLASLTMSSGLVSVIQDRSASNFDATVESNGNTNGACAIPISPADSGGRQALVGGASKLAYTCGLSASTRTQTLFWAGIIRSLVNINTMWGASNNGGRLFRVSTAGRLQCVKRNVAQLAESSAALTVAANTPFAAALVMDAANITLRLNLIAEESFAEATTFTAGLTSQLCGGDTTVSERVAGVLFEGIAYDSALSDADTTAVLTYLINKWGI